MLKKWIQILGLCSLIILLFAPESTSANRGMTNSEKPESSVQADTVALYDKKIKVEKLASGLLHTVRPLCGDNLRNELGFRVKSVEPGKEQSGNNKVWEITHIFRGSPADVSELSEGQRITSGDSTLNLLQTDNELTQNQPRQIKIQPISSSKSITISAERICDIRIKIEPSDGMNIKAAQSVYDFFHK